jgi:hypothetical protein
MTYPPQQPGNWSDPSWPNQQQQPYADPSSGAPSYPASPAGYPASPAGYPAYGYGTPVAAAPATNGMAIASLVCSLVGLVTCGVTALIGAILGHIARRQIRERGEGGDGMALAGIIVGWIVVLLSVVITGLYVALVVYAVNEAQKNPGTTFPTDWLIGVG